MKSYKQIHDFINSYNKDEDKKWIKAEKRYSGTRSYPQKMTIAIIVNSHETYTSPSFFESNFKNENFEKTDYKFMLADIENYIYDKRIIPADEFNNFKDKIDIFYKSQESTKSIQ